MYILLRLSEKYRVRKCIFSCGLNRLILWTASEQLICCFVLALLVGCMNVAQKFSNT